MRLLSKREATSAAPLTAVSDLRAAQWSGMGQLVRKGFERNVVAYRCARMIAEAAASVGFRAAERKDALARLIVQPNIEQAGPDLLENFHGHLAVSGVATRQQDGARDLRLATGSCRRRNCCGSGRCAGFPSGKRGAVGADRGSQLSHDSGEADDGCVGLKITTGVGLFAVCRPLQSKL